MTLITDERAQALQVGAVLLFGLLIILFSFWQAFVIPEQNEEVEFNHNQEVQEDMTELRSTTVSMTDSTTPQSATVNLGVRYPSRLLFANPPPASGLLQTTGTANDDVNVTIDNAVAVDEESQGARSYWQGEPMAFNTGALEYLPNYNVFNAAPRTVYEHSVVYNEFTRGGPDLRGTLALTDQALVNDNRLLLSTLTGQFEESTVEQAAVDIQPVATQSETVTIEPESSTDPITIELQTQLGAQEWRQLLDGEPVAAVRNGSTDDFVEIELENQQYQLDMARVGMGPQAEGPELAYLSGVSGPGFDRENLVAPGETYEFTVEVRNTHNVPENLVNVNASAEDGSFQGATDKRTGEDGHVTFTYEAPSSTNTEHKLWFNSTDLAEFAPNGNSSLPVTIETVGAGETPGGNTFDVEWDLEEMDNEDEFSCDESENECTILGGDDGEMSVDVTGAQSGTVDYAVVNTDAGDVDPYSTSFDSVFDATTTFEAESGLDPGESENTTVYVLGGGSSDAVTINVVSEVPEGTIAQYVPEDYQTGGGGANTWAAARGPYDLSLQGGNPSNVDYDGGAFGGAGGVEIDPSAYFASGTLSETLDEATVFVVYDDEDSGHFFSMREDGNSAGLYYDGDFGGSPTIVADDPLGLGDGPAVGTFRVDTSGSTGSWDNGNSESTGSTGSLPWNDLEIGIGADANGAFGTEITVGEVLVVDRALSPSERERQEERLIDQYDL